MIHLENVKHHPNLKIIRGNITKIKDVKTAFEGCQIVIHLAVLGLRQSIKEPHRVNDVIVKGTMNCLDIALANKMELFLNCSSSEVYGIAVYVPMDERHPLNPETPYAAAKVAQDMYVYSYGRVYGLPWTTVRPFNMYDPNSHWQGFRGELIPKMIVRALNRQPLVIFGDGDQTRDFIYIEGAARAIISVAENPRCRNQCINFCSGIETSVLQIAELICKWSNNTILGCNFIDNDIGKDFQMIINICLDPLYSIDLKIPILAAKLNYFLYKKEGDYQQIISVESNYNKEFKHVFIKTNVDGHEVFYLTLMEGIFVIPSHESNLQKKSKFLVNSSSDTGVHFLDLLPYLLFIKDVCGEKIWHSSGSFANLTIDDPWLKEPYGHLSFIKLLEEMRKADFHTTIGFIPWNYDRSKPEVSTLFFNNPDRFSICIHGNDHDHQEFYNYEKNGHDPWPAKSFDVQGMEIKKALARMEKFREITGLSYDKVMVFPHSIAPAYTLGLLKKYNFLATVNAGNVPLGSQEPVNPLFWLRPVTLEFENFPSINRYPPNRNPIEIALDLFLNNPLLFYGHPDLFEDGMDAFNETAKMVNEIDPDIIWASLGEICRHLYLQRLRDDGNYDVMVLTSDFILENSHGRDLFYFVRKGEDFKIPIKKVSVDGSPHSYERSENELLLDVFVPKGESRHVVIEYENDLDIAVVDISKNDPRVNRLRKISDFRDMVLSKNFIGRFIINIYYDTGFYKYGLKGAVSVSIVFIVIFGTSLWFIIYRIKRRKRSKL